MFRRFFSGLTNKYLLATVVFAALMLFFDQNNLLVQRKRVQRLNGLEGKVSYLQADIERMKEMLKMIEENPDYIEKYVREKYYHKKENEDVYIVTETE